VSTPAAPPRALCGGSVWRLSGGSLATGSLAALWRLSNGSLTALSAGSQVRQPRQEHQDQPETQRAQREPPRV
jgi:hypothetical protein